MTPSPLVLFPKRAGWIVSATLLLALAPIAKCDIRDTIQKAAPGTTVTVSGTYTVNAKIVVPSGVTVKGPATFRFTTGASADGFSIPSANSGVVLQSLTVTGANHGIMIYGSNCSIQSCIAQYNFNTGIEIIGAAAKNNVVNNCQSKYNADSSGGNADGFACKFGSSTGNRFTNCDGHDNSDDGYDFAGAAAPVSVSGCRAHNNGSYNGKQGNGDGFKMGIAGDNAAHIYTSCTAYNNTKGNTGSGFDSNNNAATIHLTGCTSYGNKQGDRLQHVVLTNCSMQK